MTGWFYKFRRFAARRKWWLIGGGMLLLAAGATPFFILCQVLTASERLMALEEIEPREFALVLGCAPRLANGQVNYYYKYRVEEAARVYHAGKCRRIVVSGSTSPTVDEPGSMRDDLMRLGVPSGAILPDRSGFSTFESLLTMKYYFRGRRFIIVTQKQHNIRALYMAEALGMDPAGIAAPDVRYRRIVINNLRYEFPAAIKAWITVNRKGKAQKCPVEKF